MNKKLGLLALACSMSLPAISVADTIDPTSYATTLEVGESVTIRKTVTVEESVSTGILDVMFMIDTSGSMSGPIAAAKAAAADILTGLSGYGDLSTGFGYYSEPGSMGVYQDLTTTDATTLATLSSVTIGFNGSGGGGDFPEEGINSTYEAASGASWRPGSSRFIIALGDATFKESDGTTLAAAQTALADNNVTFIGIDFGCMTCSGFSDIDPTVLADATGGSIVDSTTNTDTLIAAIIASVEASFASYDEVTVGDLGAGLPGVEVDVTCVSADIGACVDDTAVGDYDRSIPRIFEFDVTFTGAATGDWSFDTCALVDGACVATEADRITVGEGGPVGVPEPGMLGLLSLGLIGMGVARRRA